MLSVNVDEIRTGAKVSHSSTTRLVRLVDHPEAATAVLAVDEVMVVLMMNGVQRASGILPGAGIRVVQECLKRGHSIDPQSIREHHARPVAHHVRLVRECPVPERIRSVTDARKSDRVEDKRRTRLPTPGGGVG